MLKYWLLLKQSYNIDTIYLENLVFSPCKKGKKIYFENLFRIDQSFRNNGKLDFVF